MNRNLTSLNVDSTGADYAEPPATLVHLPEGVDSSSVSAMGNNGFPVTPKYTGKYDPSATPNATGSVQKNGTNYTGRLTRDSNNTTVAGTQTHTVVSKPDAIMYDKPFVASRAEFGHGVASIHYRVNNYITWRPAVRVYTKDKVVGWVEVYAKVFNNTGENLTAANFSVTLTGSSTSSQHEVNEVHYERAKSYRLESASMAMVAPSATAEMSHVGETQKFTISGAQVIPCGESLHKLYEIRGDSIKSQCFHYFYNPMTNTTQYGYAMTFNRFLPAASVSVVDYSNGTITNLGTRSCGSATPGSRYTVIVGGSVNYSPKIKVVSTEYKADTEDHGYYYKTTQYQMLELNDQVVVRIPKNTIVSMEPKGVLDIDSGHYELNVKDLKVNGLDLTVVSRNYGKNF